MLLHEGEAGLSLLLAQDLAEHASERVHVAAERVLFVIARAGGRVQGPDCMPRIDGRRPSIYAGPTWLLAPRPAPLLLAAPRRVRLVRPPPAGPSPSGPPTT